MKEEQQVDHDILVEVYNQINGVVRKLERTYQKVSYITKVAEMYEGLLLTGEIFDIPRN